MERRSLLAAAGMLTAWPWAVRAGDSRHPDVVWVPTPAEVAEEMLRLARAGPRDVVCDLGSGDGRIPILAAKRFGARGVGIEIDPELVATSRRNARAAGVGDRVRIIEGDLFGADFSEATIVRLYLMTHLNDKLRPRLLALRPGTRVVAHQFGMSEWDADEVRFIAETRALLWIVPAQVGGSWDLVGGQPLPFSALTIHQRYQRLTGEAFLGSQGSSFREGEVHGDRVRLVARDLRGVPWTLHARYTREDGTSVLSGYATDGAGLRRFVARRARARGAAASL